MNAGAQIALASCHRPPSLLVLITSQSLVLSSFESCSFSIRPRVADWPAAALYLSSQSESSREVAGRSCFLRRHGNRQHISSNHSYLQRVLIKRFVCHCCMSNAIIVRCSGIQHVKLFPAINRQGALHCFPPLPPLRCSPSQQGA